MSAAGTMHWFSLAAVLALAHGAAAQTAVVHVGLDVNGLELRSGARSPDFAPLNTPAHDPVRNETLQPNRNVGARIGEPRGNPLWAIPLSSLKVTRERPIFAPSRRPPVVAAPPPAAEPVRAPPPPEPEPFRLALTGTIAGGSVEVAVLIDKTTQQIVRLRTGESHEGWILRSVRGREVSMEKERRAIHLALPAPGEQQEPPLAQLSGLAQIPAASPGSVTTTRAGPATPPVAGPGTPPAATTPAPAPPPPSPRMPNVQPARPPV
jgi:hypothetical protein